MGATLPILQGNSEAVCIKGVEWGGETCLTLNKHPHGVAFYLLGVCFYIGLGFGISQGSNVPLSTLYLTRSGHPCLTLHRRLARCLQQHKLDLIHILPLAQGDPERTGIWLFDPTCPVTLEPSTFLFSLVSEQLMLAPAMSRSCRKAQGGQDQSVPSRSARKGWSLTLPSLLAAFCFPFAANQL